MNKNAAADFDDLPLPTGVRNIIDIMLRTSGGKAQASRNSSSPIIDDLNKLSRVDEEFH